MALRGAATVMPEAAEASAAAAIATPIRLLYPMPRRPKRFWEMSLHTGGNNTQRTVIH